MDDGYVTLKSSALPVLTGCGEQIEIVGNGRTYRFTYHSGAGIHGCDLKDASKKMILLPRYTEEASSSRSRYGRGTSMRKPIDYVIRMKKAVSETAPKWKGTCLLGYEFAEKLAKVETILEPHRRRDRPKQNQQPCGALGVSVLWSDSRAPSYTAIHQFYSKEYQEQHAAEIQEALEALGVSTKLY
jgi:hypothetical protein